MVRPFDVEHGKEESDSWLCLYTCFKRIYTKIIEI